MRISIPFKLAAILVVASVIPLAIAAGLAYYHTTTGSRALAGQQIHERALDAAEAMDTALRSLVTQLRQFAANPAVMEYLAEHKERGGRGENAPVDWESLPEDKEPLRSVLDNRISEQARAVVAHEAALVSIFVVTPPGNVIAATRRPPDGRGWLKRNVGRDFGPVVSVEKVTGELVVVVSGRIEGPERGILGYAVAMADGEHVFEAAKGRVGRRRADKQGTATKAHLDVVQEGEVISSTASGRVGRRLARDELEKLGRAPGWAVVESDGGKREFAGMRKVPLPGGLSGLSVVVREDAAEALAGMKGQIGPIVVFGGASIVLFFLVGLYISHRQIVVPIKRLTRGARSLANGDLSHRIEPHLPQAPASGPVPGDDELDDLANEFNRMADAVMTTQASLEEKVGQRTGQLAEENRKAIEARAQLEKAMTQIQETQANLIQTEKLASLGLLVAGVAHEINNPLSFILNNVSVMERDYRAILDILLRYRRLRQGGAFGSAELEAIAEDEADLDVDYLQKSVDRIFSSTLNGLNRVKAIVADLRDFSMLEEQAVEQVDVERALNTTLELVGYHLVSAGIDVIRDYGGVPAIRCSPGRLNQVFLNLIMNAIQAMADGGTIVLHTSADGERVKIKVSDTGSGIAAEHLSKIFDPFFTTKRQGDGTGLGLSVSYGIIREHNGAIDVTSEPGKGATFAVTLPLNGARSIR